MSFDVEGAKKAGYSDKEIEAYLSAPKKQSNFDVEGAKKAGYSDEEIEKFLSKGKGKEGSYFGGPERREGGIAGAVAANPLQALAEAGIQGTTGFLEAGGPFGRNVLNIPELLKPETLGNKVSLSEYLREKAGISALPEEERSELEAFGILANLLAPFAGKKIAGIGKGAKNPPGAPPPLSSVFPKPGEPGLGAPPPPPPSGPPPNKLRPGMEIPEAKGAFQQKEEIIKELEKPLAPKSLPIQPKFANVNAEAPSLQGRTSEARELSEVISKEPFETEAQAGRNIAKDVTDARNAEREIVRDKYKKAEEITSTHDDIFPGLAKQNEDRIARLELLEKRSAGEEAVYQDALTLRKMIGDQHGFIEANADRLMKQANSFSQKVKYELPYAGYKGEIKSIVHEINQAVISSLEKAGKNASAVKDADKTFARFADRFMGDEISPYFQRKILNPEQLGRKAVSDEATYRAVKDAIGSRKSPIVNKLDREVLHVSMDKYYKDPTKVNSKEYIKDLKNLSEKIGKEKTAEIDHSLRQRQLNYERKGFLENRIKEAQVPKGKPSKILEPNKPIAKTPEELGNLFNSRSDIRRLRRTMKDKGLEKEFEKLAESKVEEIFREGGFGSKKVTGSDLKRIIDKEHEILSELLGEEEVSLLYKAAAKAGKSELTIEIIVQLLKSSGKMLLNFMGLGKLVKLIPLNRI